MLFRSVEEREARDQIDIGVVTDRHRQQKRQLVEGDITTFAHRRTKSLVGSDSIPRRRPHMKNGTATTLRPMFLGAHALTTPDKPAVIMTGSGYTRTFAELDAEANRLSHLLRSAGLQPGDHVALCMENHDRYLEVLWGCQYAGVVYTAASSRLTSKELAYIINDCGARVFITSKYKADQASEIIADTASLEMRLMLDGTVPGYESYENAVAAQPSDPLPGRIAGTDMLYSSGTTGLPKGVTKPFLDLPLETTPTSVAPSLAMLFGATPDSVYLKIGRAHV